MASSLRPSPATRATVLALLFFTLVAFYAGTYSFRPITDTRLNSLQTRALVLHGDVDLSRYGPPRQRELAVRRGEHLYSIYGVGVSLFAAPVYLVLVRLGTSEALLQGAVAIPFAAAAAVVLYSLMLRLVTPGLAAAGAVVFAFGTTMWPLATTALWHHAPVALLQALGLAALFSARPRAPGLAGLAFGVATFVRPTVAILAIVVGLFYLTSGRRGLSLYVLGSLVPLVGILVQNRWIWGSWIEGGYSFAGVGFHSNFAHALFGELFGWWRGLFVYSPVLVVSFIGLAAALRRRGFVEKRLAFLGASCVLTILFYARWTTWWGGTNQFGYRYLLDLVPPLVLLGAYAVSKMERLTVLAGPLAAVSVVTMTAGSLPNRLGWDYRRFPQRFEESPIGSAWIAFLDRPLGALLRIGLIAGIGWLLFALAPKVRRANGSLRGAA